MMINPTINNLDEIVAALPAAERERFQRIFVVTTTTGELCVPPGMVPWVRQRFGPVESVSRQKVVRVTNKVTGEGTIFNSLRSLRPIDTRQEHSDRTQSHGNDLFIQPEENTPADVFGRVTGQHCITASNVAKYDGWHGLVVFKDFDYYHFTAEELSDYIDTARQWAEQARKVDPAAKYYYLLWNYLWRAGASINHGHMQMLLTRDRHYARIDGLRRAALEYRENYGTNYFDDLFQAHHTIGCAREKDGIKVLASLTPFKDNGVVLIADEVNHNLKRRVYEVLTCFRDRLKVTTFNLDLVPPPLAETEESWAGFPVIVRLVDRGDLNSQSSDVGSMEIFAQSVAASDPFELARQLR
jgi:hypothetical protein